MVRNREYTIPIDFRSTDIVETSINFKQYDYGTSTLNLQLLFDNEPLIIKETEDIYIVFKAKSNIVKNELPKSVKAKTITFEDDGTISVTVPKQILKVSGAINFEVVIVDETNGNRKTSPNIIFTIVKSILDFEDLVRGE